MIAKLFALVIFLFMFVLIILDKYKTDIGENATTIGASANVVETSMAAKEGYPISWKKYCKVCVPATIIVILISMVCILDSRKRDDVLSL